MLRIKKKTQNTEQKSKNIDAWLKIRFSCLYDNHLTDQIIPWALKTVF